MTPDHPWLPPGYVQPLSMPGLRDGEKLLCAHGDWMLMARALTPTRLPENWRTNPDPWQTLMDGDKARKWLLCTPAPGMRIAPLGMGGRHKSVGDLFTDAKTPGFLRPGWPLVQDMRTGEALWVCGLRLSHRVRVTSATECVFYFYWTTRKNAS